MVKNIKLFIGLVFCLVSVVNLAQAELVIYEVMSNEPGSQENLEWIELYNPDNVEAYLLFYTFRIDSEIEVPIEAGIIEARQYVVVCANILKFENSWGDGSGVWGDNNELENYDIIEKPDISLTDSSGSVYLYFSGQLKSTFEWSSPGLDGVSWERLSPTSSTIIQSVDKNGGTPGRENSAYHTGELIINEVMSNEPGGDRSLEWIELYNDDTTAYFSLFFFTLDANGTSLAFLHESIQGDQFAVICKDLVAFDSAWGDNSGIWGDNSEIENYQVFEKPGFSLTNGSGNVTLYNRGNLQSTFEWEETAEDGISWERFVPDSDEIVQSIDSTGSTPGRINSKVPRPYDLALLSVITWSEDSIITELEFTIANIGSNPFIDDSLFIFYDPEQDSIVGRADLITVMALETINPDDTVKISVSMEFEGYYSEILVKLRDDDRNNNNVQLLTVPGRKYPPFALSEVLADPRSPLATEWVEIRNSSDISVDISRWYIGDSIKQYPIAGSERFIAGGEYTVLCKDSLSLIDYYGEVDFPVIQPTGWPALHNDGDMVILTDNYGYAIDSVIYDSTFGDNYSWARGEELGYTETWGRSSYQGGTPGAENEVNYPASSTRIIITTEPNPFSPSRDGEMLIDFSLPPGNFSLKIYDIEGRPVKTLFDNVPAFDGQIAWNGYSNSDHRLRVGIYILYLEVFGVDQYKQTIVIAP